MIAYHSLQTKTGPHNEGIYTRDLRAYLKSRLGVHSDVLIIEIDFKRSAIQKLYIAITVDIGDRSA